MTRSSCISQPAPADYVQWFNNQLESDGLHSQIFIDSTTEIELIVCKNTPALRNRVFIATSPLPSQRTPLIAPTAPRKPLPQSPCSSASESNYTQIIPLVVDSAASSQAYGSGVDEETVTQLAHIVSSQSRLIQPVDPNTLIFTTTNRNKKKLQRATNKERERGRQRERVATGRVQKPTKPSRRRRLGLLSEERVWSDGDSEADELEQVRQEEQQRSDSPMGEAEEERGKYSQDRVALWFANAQVGVDGGSVSTTPAIQAQMVRNAMAIAGPKSVEDWKMFMETWRASGHLTSRPASRNNQLPPSHLHSQTIEVTDFYYKYKKVEACDVADSWKAITYRIRMVDLWEVLLRAGGSIPHHELPPLQRGQTLQSSRKAFLFGMLHPEFRGVIDPHISPASKKQWKTFTYRLGYAERWHTLQRELGYGILGLIPNCVVSNNWVQRTMKLNEFALWINVIKHFNPQCLSAARNWSRTLNKAISSRKPSEKRRALEDMPTASIKHFNDTSTLFGPTNSETELSGDDMVPELSLSQIMAPSSQGQQWGAVLTGLETDWRIFENNEQWIDLGELDLQQINPGIPLGNLSMDVE